MNLFLRNRNGYALPVGLRPGAFGNLLESLLEDAIVPSTENTREGQSFSPKIDVVENDRAYEIEAELPGVAKNDVKITVDRQRVTIEAEVRREASRKEGDALIHTERVIRKYARSFELAQEVDEGGAEAKMENGVLLLTLPKKQAAQSRLVTVQ